jgi:hypothetical protein
MTKHGRQVRTHSAASICLKNVPTANLEERQKNVIVELERDAKGGCSKG